MAGKRFHLLCGSFFVMVGVIDYLFKPTFNSRHRQLLTDISSHRGYGTHYVALMVGSPPQLLRLAVATGSDYTAFPCQGCFTCREPHFQYSAESVHQCPGDCIFADSTCEDGHNECRLSVQYSAIDDLSGAGYKGLEVTDYVYADVAAEVLEGHPDIATKQGFPLHFICQEDSIGDAILSDGYLGMSTAPLSYINQLHSAGKIQHRMFSMCFQDYDNYQPSGASAGHVTFGHIDRDLLDTQLIWAANTASSESLSSYAVHVRNVYFGLGGAPDYLKSASLGTMTMVPIGNSQKAGGEYASMNGEAGVVLIQTNQPTSYLHQSLEKAFKAEFLEITGMHYKVPAFKMTEEQFAGLPTVFIQFEANRASQGNMVAAELIPGFAGRHDPEHPYDILLAVPPEHYIVHLDGMAFPTLRFGPTPRIASNLLQNHELVFDLDHNRIGFAQRNHCPQGMSMMTPLTARSHTNDGAINGPQARTIDGPSQGGLMTNQGQPSGTPRGEVLADGKVSLPQDRDFVVLSSDAKFSTSTTANPNDIVSGPGMEDSRPVEGIGHGGEVLGDSAVYVPSNTANNAPAKQGRSKGRDIGGSGSNPSANPLSASGTGLAREQEDSMRGSRNDGNQNSHSSQATSAGSGNGIHGELDDAGASNGKLGVSSSSGSDRDKGRIFDSPGGIDSGTSDSTQPGIANNGSNGSTHTGGQPTHLVEPQYGLPEAQMNPGVPAFRIGPGAFNPDPYALGAVKHKLNEESYSGINVLGFVLFILGFSMTVFFTQDDFGSGVYAYLSRYTMQTGDDTDDTRAAWSKGEPFYDNSGSKNKSYKMKRNVSRKWFGAGRDERYSSNASGPESESSGGTKWGGKYFPDDQTYGGESQYPDDRTTYTTSDRTYYSVRSERPYYDRNQSVKDISDKASSGAYYQAYSQNDDVTTASSSRSEPRRDERPYYDRSKSARSTYTQSKSSRSIYSQDDDTYMDYPQKPHDDSKSTRSIYSRDYEDYDDNEGDDSYADYPQKPRGQSKSTRSIYSPDDYSYADYPQKPRSQNKSTRSIYSQDNDFYADYPQKPRNQSKLTKSVYNRDDESYADSPRKQRYEGTDTSRSLRQPLMRAESARSFYSEGESIYYPKKQDPRKLIKPVKTEDRSVYTASTDRPGMSRGLSSKSEYSYYDDHQSQKGYDEACYDDQTEGDEVSRGGTYYSDARYYESSGDGFQNEPSHQEHPSERGTAYDSYSLYEESSRVNNDDELTRATTTAPTINTGISYADNDTFTDGGTRIDDFDGDTYADVESFSGDVLTELPPTPEPMDSHPEGDEYSDVDSFYHDEVSLPSKRIARK